GALGSRVGPPFQAALQAVLGTKTLTFIGVDYPAGLFGYLEGGSPAGSTEMAWIVSALFASLVSSGYSQGGQLIHNSARQLVPDVAAHIKAVVTFGDPDDGKAVQGIPPSATDIICHPIDEVCFIGGILALLFIVLTAPAHLWVNLRRVVR
ncbi:cutinase-domain-containing protein, partial [Mycena rosella]